MSPHEDGLPGQPVVGIGHAGSAVPERLLPHAGRQVIPDTEDGAIIHTQRSAQGCQRLENHPFLTPRRCPSEPLPLAPIRQKNGWVHYDGR